ncbi:Ubiquitin-specific protease [Trichoderma lentiforme]|uniref:Ubiquitin-specific protease n=1 Tax=Trichoderma lentiforme TaxID=1567552 RepID=A0A9P4X3E8_9HYPO|nr:Ubiquitin-specific protease [Trichoderma lentiforme]
MTMNPSTHLRSVSLLSLLLIVETIQTFAMAFMLASAAISGVGLFDYEAQDSDDGISRKRRKVRRPEVLDNSEKTEPPIPTETYFDALESATEPPKEHEVDNTSAIYKNKDILADVAQYIDREDTDFLDYLDMEASDQSHIMKPNNDRRLVSAEVAAYLDMMDSDQDMKPITSSTNQKENQSKRVDFDITEYKKQVTFDLAAYMAMDDSDEELEPFDITAFKVVEPRKDNPMWLGDGPLVYNKAKPGPSPSVSSIGDIFEELGISPYDLNDGYEDDEPKITWLDDDNELKELARGLAQRYRSARAEKQPVTAPPAPKPDPAGRIEELMALPSVETLKISDESKAEVETLQAKAAETRLVDKQREKLEKERLLRDQALQKLRERTAKGPRQPVVAPLSDQWIEKIVNTIELSETDVVATTCQGTPLRRHDFATVVAAKTWLNDEIVNGALAELEKQVNLVAGITDYKQQGRKCLVMNSFFWPRVKEAGGKKTQSILRRMGVTPKNLLLMDTILIPICQEYHWTLVVVQPKQRKVMHLDSFNRPSSHPNLALAWMSDYLGDLYHAKPWEVVVLKTPHQTNGYDCGVHVITNGVCLALGLDPLQSYNVGEMALQRLRIAGMLLNGGFEGDFDLWQQ